MMEGKDAIIIELRDKIKEQDEIINKAAKFGIKLSTETSELSAKIQDLLSQIELLQQQKHSLQLELEAKALTTHELEFQRDQADKFEEKFQIANKEKEGLLKKIDSLKKENQYLKKMQDDLNIENKPLKDKISLLEKQIKNFEDQAEKSLYETDKDESQDLQAQLNTYMLNNRELQDSIFQLQCELEKSKKNEKHLEQIIQELEETLCERNTQISTFNSEMKIAKEEIEELKAEIESFKFDQVDVKRRGNSVFAELDDRRHLVEKEYKTLLEKFTGMQKKYEENKRELDRARGQIVFLQSMTSRQSQESYIGHLENSLSSARMEISDLTHKLSKAVKTFSKSDDNQNHPQKNNYDYLRVMLKQSQKKEKELLTEVATLKLKIMDDDEKLSGAQYSLYKATKDLECANLEISNLKLKIKDLEEGILLSLPVETAPRKPRIEYLENYKPAASNKSNESVIDFTAALQPAPDIIPAELELCEDGFKQVKPSRKSNRFILRQFNTVDNDDQDSVNPLDKKEESVCKSKYEIIAADEKERKAKQVTSQRKISSRKKDDNCAQQ